MHRLLSLAVVASVAATGCGGLASGSAGAPDAGPKVETGTPDAGRGPHDAPTAPRDALPEAGGTCAVGQRMLKTDSSPIQMLTDAEHLYWFDNDFGPARVFVTDKCAPGPVTRLAKLPELGSYLAQDATNLYLATFSSSPAGGDAGVYAISKASGAIQKLVDAPMGADGVAVQGGWVYWTESNTNRVGRILTGGGGSPDILPFLMTAPERVAVLLDGTVCVVGVSVECMLPSSTIVTVPVPPSIDGPLVDPLFLTNDDSAIYVVAKDPSGVPTVLRATASPSPAVATLLDDPGDAGMLSLSGVVALSNGVYVACGTGTAVWVPSAGSPLTAKTIASTLPPFVFFADADGVYWDAGEGVELGPPIPP